MFRAGIKYIKQVKQHKIFEGQRECLFSTRLSTETSKPKIMYISVGNLERSKTGT